VGTLSGIILSGTREPQSKGLRARTASAATWAVVRIKTISAGHGRSTHQDCAVWEIWILPM